MQTFEIGDQAIPALGLGTWKSLEQEAYDAVRKAIDIGYRHFDCAWIYANEDHVGRALSDAMASGDVQRSELWITSKLWNTNHRVEHVRPALEGTLKDLRLDYLDLYLMHWPIALKHDTTAPISGDDFVSLAEVPLAETWSGLQSCVEQGLCRHIGVSNFSSKKLLSLMNEASIKPVVNQVESHPYLQQTKLLEFCRKHDILLTAYSPLGSPDRPDRLRKSQDPKLWDHPVITQIAERRNLTAPQVMISWAISRGTIAIPKSSRESHLRDNFLAAQVSLDETELSAIAKMDLHYRFIDGTFWAMPGSPYTVAELWDE